MVAILVTCGTPDRLNSNLRLRANIAYGFTELGIESKSLEIGQVQGALKHQGKGLLLITGSIADASINLSELVRLARSRGTQVAFWLHDDPYEFDLHWRLSNLECTVFSNEPNCLEAYPPKCRARALALAASPLDSFQALGYTAKDKKYDLGFCGVAFPQRIAVMRMLIAAGFTISCWGEGWPADLTCCTNKRLGPLGLSILYRNCRFILNLGRDIIIANTRQQIAPSMPGPRTFEAALHGVVQLYIGQSPQIEKYYGPDKGVLQVESIEEIDKQIKKARSEPDWLKSLGEAAANHTKRHHYYRHRCHDLLAAIKADYET